MRASPLNFGLKDCLTAGLSKQPSVSCSRTDAWAIVKGLTLSGQGSEHDKNAKKLSTAQPMLQNQGKQLDGKGITLLPYAAAHVRGWHALLSEDDALKRSLVSLFVTDHSFAQLKQQDPEILKATASEPLSLEEEYEMQKKWVEDEDKCTFIVVDQDLAQAAGAPHHTEGMVGDVNLFLRQEDDVGTIAELEVMIAEVGSRRKGLASQAVVMMMQWACQHLGLDKFEVKIGDANAASLALFKRLGFQTVGHSSVFEETCLALNVSQAQLGPQIWQELGLTDSAALQAA